METLTYDRTVELLHEAVAEKGENYVYTNPYGVVVSGSSPCFYVHNTPLSHTHENGEPVPGCIVGNVLHRAGVSLNELDHSMTASHLIASLTRYKLINVEPKAKILLQMVQSKQDNGKTWGEAVRFGIEYVNASNKGG